MLTSHHTRHFHCLFYHFCHIIMYLSKITSLSFYCATDDDSCIAIKTFGTNYLVQSRAIEVLHQVDHTELYC